VPIVHRAGAWRRVWPWLTAVAAVAVLLAVLPGFALAHDSGAGGQVARVAPDQAGHLRDAQVLPRTARPGATIHFAVTWHGPGTRTPRVVRVVIDGRPRVMSVAHTDALTGTIKFAAATALPAGRHQISFEAIVTNGRRVAIRAGVVVIAGHSTTSGGGTGAGGGPSGVGPNRTDGAESGPDPVNRPQADGPHDTSSSGSSDGGAEPPAVPTGGSEPSAGPTSGPAAPSDPAPSAGASSAAAPDGIGSVEGSAGDERGKGLGSAGLRVGARSHVAPLSLGLLGPADDPFDRAFRAFPVLISTGGSAIVWAAFVLFGKRRRDGDPPAPDPVLAAYAAAAPEPVPTASLVPAPLNRPSVPPGVDPSEAGLPRWRRPSLLLARKTDPLRTASADVSLTFDEATVAAPDGIERRRIRYRLVRLLDVPDEVRASEIGILDAGDEVEILDSRGTYRLVLCPDGQRGWLHRMVLGDLVEADDPDDAPDGIDEDVLAAFLTTRQKTA